MIQELIPIAETHEPLDDRAKELLWLMYLEAEWRQRHGEKTMPAPLEPEEK